MMLALPLARRAQRVTDTPLDELVVALARRRRTAGVAPDRIALAAARATARWARWFGGLDSCLTRSLVAGAMLAGRGGVALHIGFRPGQGEQAVDGHAWITVGGRPVGIDAALAEEAYTRTLSIPFGEGAGGPR
jgi:hypothetical protein